KGGTMRFTGKVAVITAFANGIGRATAEIMAREGAIVVGVDNHRGRLDEAVAALCGAGGTAHGRLCDALDAGQAEAAVASVEQEFGRVDILVNAVGGSTIIANSGAGVDELTFAEWQRLIAFNLDGTFLFTHTVVPIMKRQRHGKIVNLASIAGRGLSETSSSAYAAAKGGIIAFTRKLAFELGPYGVTINAIAPSLTLTERIRPHWERRTAEAQAAEIARTPLRRVAKAADQAKGTCFLASSDADFVSGVTIDVAGGNLGNGNFCSDPRLLPGRVDLAARDEPPARRRPHGLCPELGRLRRAQASGPRRDHHRDARGRDRRAAVLRGPERRRYGRHELGRHGA